jgi:hypothetical protein
MEINQKDNPEKIILEKIEDGVIKKRPHWQFVAENILAIMSITVLFLIAIFLLSFIFETLRGGPPAPNQSGISPLSWFPWTSILLTIGIGILLALILKQFRFIYHYPYIYLALGLIGILVICSLIANATSFHSRFSRFSQQHDFPMSRQFYGDFPEPMKIPPQDNMSPDNVRKP